MRVLDREGFLKTAEAYDGCCWEILQEGETISLEVCDRWELLDEVYLYSDDYWEGDDHC